MTSTNETLAERLLPDVRMAILRNLFVCMWEYERLTAKATGWAVEKIQRRTGRRIDSGTESEINGIRARSASCAATIADSRLEGPIIAVAPNSSASLFTAFKTIPAFPSESIVTR